MGVFGDGRALRGLYEDPAGTFEGDLEGLPTPATHEGLERDVGADAGAYAAAPRYCGFRVGEARVAGVEEDGLSVRGYGDLAGAFERDVEEAAGETARALDAPDVPVNLLRN